MKNYITLTAAAIAALTFGACSDDDVVDFRPAAEIEGLVEAENFDLDVNGYPVPSRAVFLLSDTAQRSNPSDTYEMILAMDAFNKEKIRVIDKYADIELESLRFPVTVTGDQNGMTFSGSVSDCGVTYTVEGTMPVASSTSKKVKAHVTCDASALPYAGMTYEIPLDGSGINCYVGVIPGEKTDFFGKDMAFDELVEEFYKRIINSYSQNSGYNSALITFNPDLTMKVMMRKNSDGLYEEIEGHFSYKPMGTGYIGFMADPDFSLKQEKWLSIGNDLLAAQRFGVRYPTLGNQVIYEFIFSKSDGIIELRNVSSMSFLNGWCFGDSDTPMCNAHNYIASQVRNNDNTFISVGMTMKPLAFGKE